MWSPIQILYLKSGKNEISKWLDPHNYTIIGIRSQDTQMIHDIEKRVRRLSIMN